MAGLATARGTDAKTGEGDVTTDGTSRWPWRQTDEERLRVLWELEPVLAWSRAVGDAHPIGAGGSLAVFGVMEEKADQQLVAIDLSTGKEQWQTQAWAEHVVIADRVAITGINDDLEGYAGDDGRPLWTRWGIGDHWAEPWVERGEVKVETAEGVATIDPQTGHSLEVFGSDAGRPATPSLWDGLALGSLRIYRYNDGEDWLAAKQQGRRLWKMRLPTEPSDLYVCDNCLLLVLYEDSEYSLWCLAPGAR